MLRRQLFFYFVIFCILFSLINCKSQCSCSCCKGNGCVKRHQGFINMPTCSATSCKNACKLRHHAQCAGTPGSILATCTKTETSHRLSPTKKIKHKTKISSSNKHTNRRT
ncbi:unnamed protein product [Adineta steineri]|uniref:Uncharacterized protein n=1 Tax=Adineta steineri TaxID=433720 RepID=A0A819M2J6_9BILA|nr:unnamed protein product [Adineta steineri]